MWEGVTVVRNCDRRFVSWWGGVMVIFFFFFFFFQRSIHTTLRYCRTDLPGCQIRELTVLGGGEKLN